MKKRLASSIITITMLVMMLCYIPIESVEASSEKTTKPTPTTTTTEGINNNDGLSIQGYRITIRWRWKLKYRKKKKKKKRVVPKLSQKKISIYKGDYDWIRLNKAKAKKVKWYSSNRKIATVKKDGSWCKIKAKKKGTVYVIAKYKGRYFKCKVKVKQKKKKAFSLLDNKNNETIYIDRAEDEPEVITFESSLNNISLSYYIDNPNIVDCKWGKWDGDFSDLKVYPYWCGITWITVKNSYNSQKAKFKVVVYDSDIMDDGYYPIDTPDFYCLFANNGESEDVISLMESENFNEYLTWYDEAIDGSKESVVTTNRGIHIGDKRETVEKVYGRPNLTHARTEEPLLIGGDLENLFAESALSHIHYFTKEGYCITFFFDKNDEVSWIIFTDKYYSQNYR